MEQRSRSLTSLPSNESSVDRIASIIGDKKTAIAESVRVKGVAVLRKRDWKESMSG